MATMVLLLNTEISIVTSLPEAMSRRVQARMLPDAGALQEGLGAMTSFSDATTHGPIPQLSSQRRKAALTQSSGAPGQTAPIH